MNLSPQFIVVISGTLLIFLGYLNTCTSNHYRDDQESIPKIWPNISDNHSFLQFPGLTGSGGLDFSFYDAFAKIVNKTRGLPQFALMAAVGGLLAGVAVLLSEAAIFKKYHKEHDELLIGAGAYGAPPSIAYGAPSSMYGAPSPPSTYGAPSPPSTYGAPSPPSTYGVPSPPSTYGSPPSTYGAPSPPSTYGAPSPPSTYGASSPPSTYGSPPSTYGAPSPPSTYGSPPSTYGAPSPPSTYGAPSPPSTYESPPSTYGAPSPPSSYGAP